MQPTTTTPQKVVRKIPAKIDIAKEIKEAHRQFRVAAYCRVSTAQEEQLNSYDVQVRYYSEKIRSEPKWAFVGIFADSGLSGTSTKKPFANCKVCFPEFAPWRT